MIPHVHQALEELGVLAMNSVNGDTNSGGGKNKKVSQKSHRKARSKAEGREGYWDDLCLARFLEGVCWRFVAYPVCPFILSVINDIHVVASAPLVKLTHSNFRTLTRN